MSKVSVVVPIYNPGKKLQKCIKSILNQTFNEFELILVNDGSTDGSLEICNKYRSKDKRVTVINKKNEGSIATRRIGVQAANSEYVMFVDADDWIERNALETLYTEMVKNESDITVCNLVKVLGNNNLIKRINNNKYFIGEKNFNEKEIKKDLVVAYFHGHPFPSSLCAKLYKKELLLNSGKWLDQIKFFGEDLFYNLEIFLKAKKVKVINKPLYYYRVGGFSSKYMPYFFDDMINGYKIQKDVINEYYLDSIQSQLNGISIMLLNTFKTCLINIFYSNLTYKEKMDMIRIYVSSKEIKEALTNHGAKKYFSTEFLESIENQRVDYLYSLGESMYKKARPKKFLVGVLSNLI